MNNELLNKTAELLQTTDKTLCIFATLKILINDGMSATQAYDTVFGEGSSKKLTEELYHKLREKAGV